MHSVDKREKTGRLRKNVVRGKTTQNLKNPIGKVFLLTKKIIPISTISDLTHFL